MPKVASYADRGDYLFLCYSPIYDGTVFREAGLRSDNGAAEWPPQYQEKARAKQGVFRSQTNTRR